MFVLSPDLSGAGWHGRRPRCADAARKSGYSATKHFARAYAEELRGRLAQVAAPFLGVPAEQIVFRDDMVSGGGKALPFAEVAHKAWLARVSLAASGFYATPDIHFDRASGRGNPFYYFAYGVAATEAIVDCFTGEYRFTRADLLHDCGNSLNPAIDLGQVEGG